MLRRGFGNPFKVLFFGSDRFSVHTLRSLLDHAHDKSLIETIGLYFGHSDQYKNPVWNLGNEKGLDKIVVPQLNDPSAIKKFSEYNIAVVSSFGKFLPRACINAFETGAINVHPSLLPRYRGASPLQYAIMNLERKSGISIIEVHPSKIDAGRILKQTEVDISSDATYLSLMDDLGALGGRELVDTLRNYAEYKRNAREQHTIGNPSVTKKITIEMSIIDWNKSSYQIEALYRAIGYLYHLRSTFRGKRIRLDGISVADDYGSGRLMSDRPCEYIAGTLCATKELLYIKCGSGWISASTASVGNSRFLSPAEMINGYKISKSDVLGAI